MQVTSVVQLPDGKTVKFDAELGDKEFGWIFNVGLTHLIMKGAINPDLYKEEEPKSVIVQ
jgi:hypothetical protein